MLSRTHQIFCACLSVILIPPIAIGESLSELQPSLLAVTITDFEVGESSNLHSAYWAYEAEVDANIAGPKFEGKIRFIVAKAVDIRRVFPAQYVPVFQGDRADLEEQMGTLIEAISMPDTEKTACFTFDLTEVFSRRLQVHKEGYRLGMIVRQLL